MQEDHDALAGRITVSCSDWPAMQRTTRTPPARPPGCRPSTPPPPGNCTPAAPPSTCASSTLARAARTRTLRLTSRAAGTGERAPVPCCRLAAGSPPGWPTTPRCRTHLRLHYPHCVLRCRDVTCDPESGCTFHWDGGDPSAQGDITDEEGHGTHTAGLIGAVADNGRGGAGLGWNVSRLRLVGSVCGQPLACSPVRAARTSTAAAPPPPPLASPAAGLHLRVPAGHRQPARAWLDGQRRSVVELCLVHHRLRQPGARLAALSLLPCPAWAALPRTGGAAAIRTLRPLP